MYTPTRSSRPRKARSSFIANTCSTSFQMLRGRCHYIRQSTEPRRRGHKVGVSWADRRRGTTGPPAPRDPRACSHAMELYGRGAGTRRGTSVMRYILSRWRGLRCSEGFATEGYLGIHRSTSSCWALEAESDVCWSDSNRHE
jgi:hypothetical protein